MHLVYDTLDDEQPSKDFRFSMLLCIDDILAFVSILQFSRNAQEFDDKNAFDTTLKKLKNIQK